MKFTEKLQLLSAKRRLTQTTLGDAIGINNATVSRWLSGKSKPYNRTAIRLAQFFGVSVEELMDDSCDLSIFEINERKSCKNEIRISPKFIQKIIEFKKVHEDLGRSLDLMLSEIQKF